MRRALLALALAGCFQRGKAREHDAGAAPVHAPDAAPAPPLAPTHVEPTGPADPSATIAIALEAAPPSLDPLRSADAITQRVVMGDVFEGLVAPGPTLGDPPIAALADRWTASPDGTRWTFHLRDARWHDGHPVRAADVAATIAAIGKQASFLAADLDDLAGVDVVDDRDVTLRFHHARPDQLSRLAAIPIEPGGATDPRHPIGSGPLRVTAWSDDRIELTRNDGYWGAPAGAAAVVYRIAADRAGELRLLAAGDVDVVVQVPVAEADDFAAAHPPFGTFGYRLPAYLAAIYDARRPALATADARRALTALLDRAGIAARLFHAPTITGPFPERDPGSDTTVVPVPFDRELAAHLLAGADPQLTILVPQGSTTMAKVADIWASDARGVAELSVTQVPFADLLARLAAGDFDIAMISMSTGPELDLAPRLSSHAPRDTAWTGLADPETDRLLDAIAAEPDAVARATLRRALHRRIAAQQPMAFLAPDQRLGLASARIGGLAGAPEGAPPHAARLWKAP